MRLRPSPLPHTGHAVFRIQRLNPAAHAAESGGTLSPYCRNVALLQKKKRKNRGQIYLGVLSYENKSVPFFINLTKLVCLYQMQPNTA